MTFKALWEISRTIKNLYSPNTDDTSASDSYRTKEESIKDIERLQFHLFRTEQNRLFPLEGTYNNHPVVSNTSILYIHTLLEIYVLFIISKRENTLI